MNIADVDNNIINNMNDSHANINTAINIVTAYSIIRINAKNKENKAMGICLSN